MAEHENNRVKRIFGYVRQAESDAGVAGAIVRIYRQVGDEWQRIATRATDALGYWECDAIGEALDAIRITEENPPDTGDGGWPSVPLGTLVRGLNAVHIPHPTLPALGPIIFYDLPFKLIAQLRSQPSVP